MASVAFAIHEGRFGDSTNESMLRDILSEVAYLSGREVAYFPGRFSGREVAAYFSGREVVAYFSGREVAYFSGRHVNYGSEWQLIHEIAESFRNQILEDGSTNWNLPPRFDVTPYESDDAEEMVQDYVADLQLMIEQLTGSSISLELPTRYDEYIDDAVDVMQEAHVVPDDVADVPQEDHVVEDHVANLPQEAHVVEDHVANLQQECAICVTNARGMAFLCGHTTCVECGERLDRCPICREPIIYRIRLFLE